jgi:hypothetical protein
MAFTLRGELSRAVKDRGSKFGDVCSHPHEREREEPKNRWSLAFVNFRPFQSPL